MFVIRNTDQITLIQSKMAAIKMQAKLHKM
jgi:hypothetical protein